MFDQLKTLALLGALTVLLVGIGGAVAPGQVDTFLFFALVLNLGAYFFSDRLVLAMNGARELARPEAPELFQLLDELATKAGIPTPRLFLMPTESPNAFATGRSPAHAAVAVTQGILRLLDARELRAVLAHELGHVLNRDTLVSTVAAVLASVVTHVAHSLRWGLVLGDRRRRDQEGPGAGAWLIALVAPLAATLIRLAISRTREFHADETGARLVADPESLARALLKLEHGVGSVPARSLEPATASLFIMNPLAGAGSLMSWFSTHPPTEERVARLHELTRELGRR